ncbi:MAG TPA: hypothetical protein VMT11_14725 [Myxococcaceae bacterium]|nr:hypothetical protein [Myxococcaceae bacterium]
MHRIQVACFALLTLLTSCATSSPQPTTVQQTQPELAPTPAPIPPPSTLEHSDQIPLAAASESLTTEDVKVCSDPRDPALHSYYLKLRPRRGFYYFKLLRTPKDVTIVIVRASEDLSGGRPRSPVPLPAVEKIIGPIPRKDVKAWHLVYAMLRRYASSPPAGNYCWDDDCYGSINQLIDPHDEGDPRPGDDPPGQPPTGGYMVALDPPYPPLATLDPEVDTVGAALAGREPPMLRYLVQPGSAPAPTTTSRECVDPSRLKMIKEQAAQIVKIGSSSSAQSKQ